MRSWEWSGQSNLFQRHSKASIPKFLFKPAQTSKQNHSFCLFFRFSSLCLVLFPVWFPPSKTGFLYFGARCSGGDLQHVALQESPCSSCRYRWFGGQLFHLWGGWFCGGRWQNNNFLIEISNKRKTCMVPKFYANFRWLLSSLCSICRVPSTVWTWLYVLFLFVLSFNSSTSSDVWWEEKRLDGLR